MRDSKILFQQHRVQVSHLNESNFLRLLIVFTFVIVLSVNVKGSDCRILDTLFSISGKAAVSADFSESCLCSLLAESPRRSESDLISFIKESALNYSLSDTVLFCAWRLQLQNKSPSVFAAVFRAWKQKNPSPSDRIMRYRRDGALDKVDTLCTILDSGGGLDIVQLLRWIEVKGQLEDYEPVPALVCRVVTERPELTWAALDQFGKILDPARPQLADILLERFVTCAFAVKKIDSAAVKSWVIEQYGRRELFERQLEMLTAIESNASKRNEIILSIARQRFRQRQYSPAATAAERLYKNTSDESMRREAAFLLYKSYREMGFADSAKKWLEHAEITKDVDRFELVEFYQKTGELSKAASLIPLLPKSLAADTFRIRQYLLCDSAGEAVLFIENSATYLSRSPNDRLLWLFRSALYSGKTDICLAAFNSSRIDPSHPYASELMEYQYWLMRLDGDSEGLAKFIQIEYTLFKGDLKKAARLLCEAGPMGGNAWRIALRIARRQLDKSEAAGAVVTLRCTPAEGEPEYLFRLAEAHFSSGSGSEARGLLERLIVEFPESPYSVQGRLLLSRIR